MAFWLVQEKADRQVQICGKNVPPHPCGELQLILHLPTRRQRERELFSGDWRVNPDLAIRRRPGPLIMSGRQERLTGRRGGRQKAEAGRQTGEVRREERRGESSRETPRL